MKIERKEIKYVVDYERIHEIKNKFLDIFNVDKNISDNNNFYRVFSVYFDNHNFSFYKDKIEGLNIRVKPRLRYYLDNNLKIIKCFLELKKRNNFITIKNKIHINVDDSIQILNGNINKIYYKYKDIQFFKNFFILYKKNYLRPKISIVYDRSAYYYKYSNNFRLTIDRNIMTSIYNGIELNLNNFMKVLSPSKYVLEVKYNYSFPDIVLRQLKRLNLTQSTYSKYVESVNAFYNFKL